jgi:hypothetical protein
METHTHILEKTQIQAAGLKHRQRAGAKSRYLVRSIEIAKNLIAN